VSNKTLGKKGEDLIKGFEQLRLVGYLPTPNDVPTIGWGATRIFGRKVVLGETITEEQAQEQFLIDTKWAVDAVNSLVKVEINQNQFDALVSITFNIGKGAFSASTLLKLLNQGNFEGAANQFGVWIKQNKKVLNGLVKRRKVEKDLFLTEE